MQIRVSAAVQLEAQVTARDLRNGDKSDVCTFAISLLAVVGAKCLHLRFGQTVMESLNERCWGLQSPSMASLGDQTTVFA